MTGKDAGFRIRVERDLRDKFIEMCRAQDKPAAQVLREFMRLYVAENEREPSNIKQKRGSTLKRVENS